jgi:hypothetical protein
MECGKALGAADANGSFAWETRQGGHVKGTDT